MAVLPHVIITLSAFFAMSAIAEVKEMSNTEMTEAFIQDGAIVIKQKAIAPTPKKKLKYKVGPGEPITTEAESVSTANQHNAAQFTVLDNELNRDLSESQLRESQLNQTAAAVGISTYLSPAQQAQQQHAQDIVRAGLGLPAGSEITPEIMGQYLTTFSGQSYGDPLGAQQSVNANGFQITIPNPGGQYDAGVFPSGDNTMNVQTTDSQLIFNLIFPKE